MGFLHIPGGWEWGFLNHQQYHVIHQQYPRWLFCDTLPDTLSVKLKRELGPFNEIVMATELILYQNPVVFVVRFILELSKDRLWRRVAERCMGTHAFPQHGII